jgi:hypothetical protein
LGVQLARARARDLVAITPSTIDGESVSEKTYVDFDVAVVVGESETTMKGGEGKTGGEIQVASIIKANIGGGGKIESGSTASTEQTHRVAFKVPIFMNAHFRNNPLASADSKELLSAHGISDATSKPPASKHRLSIKRVGRLIPTPSESPYSPFSRADSAGMLIEGEGRLTSTSSAPSTT